MRRSLYYFICPLRDAWRWNIERIKSFWSVFNARKVVFIATGSGLAPPEDVKKAFGLPGIEFVTTENDWFLGETKSFLKGLEIFESTDPENLIFYAHAKGVSHEGDQLSRVLQWSDAMYSMNLGSSALVDSLMRRYNAVGCFRYRGTHGGASWHYSGTFYWLRCSALFSREWRSIERSRFGVEGYPGIHFNQPETFDLAPEDPARNLYINPPTQDDCRQWLAALKQKELT